MRTEITVKNYRCFPDTTPTRIALRQGLTAFVGINNSGKSSLLKFFYEFRNLFSTLGQASGNLISAIKESRESTQIIGIQDPEEIFCNGNNRELEIDFRFMRDGEPAQADATRFVVTVHRDTRWTAKLFFFEAAAKTEVRLNPEPPLVFETTTPYSTKAT